MSLQQSEWYILYCTDSPDPLQSRQGYESMTEQEENCSRGSWEVTTEKGCKALKPTAQGSGGVTTPGGAKNVCI